MGKNQHVVKNDEHWSVKGEGNERATKNHETQKEAIAHAESIAQNQGADVIIHKADGEIRARKSFSDQDTVDPISPKTSIEETSDNSNSPKQKKTSNTPSSQNSEKISFWNRIKSLFKSKNKK